jgi:hypothetical protein
MRVLGEEIRGSLVAIGCWVGGMEREAGALKQGQGCEFGKQSPELKRPKFRHALIADGDAMTSRVYLDGFRY